MHSAPGQAEFPTARWILIAPAGDVRDPDNRGALESFCAAYWYPLYAFVRRRATLEHGYFERADREKGRFRSFLLSAFHAGRAARILGRRHNRKIPRPRPTKGWHLIRINEIPRERMAADLAVGPVAPRIGNGRFLNFRRLAKATD